MARRAADLAVGAGVALPSSLALWGLAGGRPRGRAEAHPEPHRALGSALEAALGDEERRRGAHYTPAALAEAVAAAALPTGVRRPVVDPACGGGSLLLAAAERLVAHGAERRAVAAELLWGADIDPLAVAVTEAAVALWSGGTVPRPGHLVAGDPLEAPGAPWGAVPAGGATVVANPPFQGQLRRRTARPAETDARLRGRFGSAWGQYTDTAALFLLAALDLAGPTDRVAVVLPRSVAGARDSAGVRATVAERAELVDLLLPERAGFTAAVQVCVAVLAPGAGGAADWTDRLAGALGVPAVDPHRRAAGRLGDAVATVAGFRQHYYALVGHVADDPGAGPEAARLVTSGALDPGRSRWGEVEVRFAGRTWRHPVVDRAAVAAATPAVAGWLDRTARPKVLVASQTKVLEAVADPVGAWVPGVPVVAVVPHDPDAVPAVAALLGAPPVAAWAARRAGGTGRSVGSIRVSAPLLADAPLPADGDAWTAAARLLADGDLEAYAEAATAMYRLPRREAARVVRWWHQRRPEG